MVIRQYITIMDHDLDMRTTVDREILLSLLIAGDNTPTNLSELADRHVQSIYERISRLEEEGLIENKGRGVYTLTTDGVRMAQAVRREFSDEDGLDFS